MGESRHVFLVQGSAAEPYEVLIVYEGNEFNAQCSCPAGNNKQLCKHVIGIINYAFIGNNRVEIVSDNEGEAFDLHQTFSGTKSHEAMNDLDEAEKALKDKKAELKKLLAPFEKEVKDRKKQLQRTLLL